MIVTVILTLLYYDYTYRAIAPVQKADNLYPLDDSAIGFTNTYPLERYPAFEQPGHGADSRKCPKLNGPEIKYSLILSCYLQNYWNLYTEYFLKTR